MERLSIRVAGSAVRCPFCDLDIDVNGDRWAACGSCLSRQHAGCWAESGVCASCRNGTLLAPAAPLKIRITLPPTWVTARRRKRREAARLRRWLLGTAITTILVGNAAAALIIVVTQQSRMAPFMYSPF
jgi:hypothetical protein